MPGPFLPIDIAKAAKRAVADVGRRIPLPSRPDLDVPNPFNGFTDRLTGGLGATPGGVFEATGVPNAARTAAKTYTRAQQGSLGFFTGDNPYESVQQAYRGARGEQEFSPQDLGYVRQMPEGSTQRRVGGDIIGRIVDPFTLATLGSGATVRAAETGADVFGPLLREGARRAGAGEAGQTVADIAGSIGGGIGGAKALGPIFKQAERTATTQIKRGIQPGMSIKRLDPEDDPFGIIPELRRVTEEEDIIRSSGIVEAEKRAGYGAKAGEIRRQAEQSAYGERLSVPRGQIRQTLPGQMRLDDDALSWGHEKIKDMVKSDQIQEFQGIRLTNAWDKAVSGRGLQPKEREALGEWLGEDVARAFDDLVSGGGGGRPRPRPTAYGGGGGGPAKPPAVAPAARLASRLAKVRDDELAKQAAAEINARRSNIPVPPSVDATRRGIGKAQLPPEAAEAPGMSAAQRVASEARKNIPEPTQKATALDQALDILNIPRTLKSSFDISAPFRQGAVLSARNPDEFWGAWGPMVRSFGDKATAEAVDREIRGGAAGIIRSRTKLYLAPLDDAALSVREEAFASRLASRVPGIEHSQRAYVTFLNKLRADVFDKNYQRLVESGLKGEELIKAQDELANFINIATGRGNIKGPEMISALTNIFFSPRLLASRFQTFRAALPRGIGGSIQNDVVRRIAQENVGAWMGQNLAILGVLSATGLATVELDPRSSEWMKLRVGNTRIDPWAGFQQIARAGAQISTGQVKTSSGDVAGKTRLRSAGDFARSKLNPVVGTGVDLALEETAIGKPVTTRQQQIVALLSMATPLAPQDIYAGWVEQGVVGGALGTAGVVGLGASSYSTPTEKLERTGYDEDAPGLALRAALSLQSPEQKSAFDQFEKMSPEAWRIIGGTETGAKTYGSWYQNTYEKYRKQAIANGFSESEADVEAKDAIENSPTYKEYSVVKNDLEDRWGTDHPEAAALLLDRESEIPERERTFRPTMPVREYISSRRKR